MKRLFYALVPVLLLGVLVVLSPVSRASAAAHISLHRSSSSFQPTLCGYWPNDINRSCGYGGANDLNRRFTLVAQVPYALSEPWHLVILGQKYYPRLEPIITIRDCGQVTSCQQTVKSYVHSAWHFQSCVTNGQNLPQACFGDGQHVGFLSNPSLTVHVVWFSKTPPVNPPSCGILGVPLGQCPDGQ